MIFASCAASCAAVASLTGAFLGLGLGPLSYFSPLLAFLASCLALFSCLLRPMFDSLRPLKSGGGAGAGFGAGFGAFGFGAACMTSGAMAHRCEWLGSAAKGWSSGVGELLLPVLG